MRIRRAARGMLLAFLISMACAAHAADGLQVPFSMSAEGRQAPFPATDGRIVYERLCQGCHMSDGAGAKAGPASYPAVAGNPRFAARAYPAVVIVNGLGAMPAFGTQLSDAQVAAVVNFLRTSFGNQYNDPLADTEVPALRPAAQARPTELRGR